MVNLTQLKELTNELNSLTFGLAAEIESGKFGPLLTLLSIVLNNVETITFVFDKNGKILFMNIAAQTYLKNNSFDVKIGDIWWKVCFNLKERPIDTPTAKALISRQIITEPYKSPKTGATFNVTAVPLLFNGSSGTICFVKLMG